MSRNHLVGLSFLLIGFPSLAAAEPVTKENVDVLVAQLVSPNRAPIERDGDVDFPPGFDTKAQEKVIGAARTLLELGPPAFPHLFDHFADKRYSLTALGGAAIRNRTVGRVCHDIVEGQLQPYGTFAKGARDARTIPLRPYYPSRFKLDDPKRAKAWWKTHKDRSLRELQIEVLEWVITEEAKAPDKYFDDERETLHDLLNELQTSDKPLQPSVWYLPSQSR